MTEAFRPRNTDPSRRSHAIWWLGFTMSLLLFAFIRLTCEMLEGETRHFDEMILLGLRQSSDLATPIGPVWLTKMMTDLTALGGTTVLSLITVLVVLFLGLRGSAHTAAYVTVSILGGWLLSTVLKIGVARPRPELVPHLVVVGDFSFPSGHAMLSAVTYLTLGALLSRMEQRQSLKLFHLVTAFLLTVIVGCSRVYLGVHYPTDVVGGWTAGAAWASSCWLVSHWVLLASKADHPTDDTNDSDHEGCRISESR